MRVLMSWRATYVCPYVAGDGERDEDEEAEEARDEVRRWRLALSNPH